MSTFDPNSTQEVPLDVQTGLVAQTVPEVQSGPPPVADKHSLPAFEPTRFRKLLPFEKLLKKQ